MVLISPRECSSHLVINTKYHCIYLILQNKATPLIIACLNGHYGVALSLIEAQADTNGMTIVSSQYHLHLNSKFKR